jgi:Tfp pilus assembly protein PilF
MAYVYIEDGEYASARNHLNIALEIDPELEKAKVALEKLNEEH